MHRTRHDIGIHSDPINSTKLFFGPQPLPIDEEPAL